MYAACTVASNNRQDAMDSGIVHLKRKIYQEFNKNKEKNQINRYRTIGQTHYKMISCNIWLPVVIHRSKTRNNALDVFWGIETIIMPLSRQPQKKSFCPVSHSLAPTFMKIFFIMRLPCTEQCLWPSFISLIINKKMTEFLW